MKKNNKTLTVGELINTTTFAEVVRGNKFGMIAKQSTIFSFWQNVVGSKFANCTKPDAIKNSKLYVSAKSPVIIQELSLYKNKILKKINSYSMPLGLEIKDIIFNYKNYSAQIPKSLSQVEDRPKWIQKDELDNVSLDEKIKEEIQKNISKIKFLNENQKETFYSKILSTYQAKAFRDN